MKPKTITLEEGERIIAVVPELAVGPGWANAPTWVYIKRTDGTLREECIQPQERTPDLHVLWKLGLQMCDALLRSIPTTHKKEK